MIACLVTQTVFHTPVRLTSMMLPQESDGSMSSPNDGAMPALANTMSSRSNSDSPALTARLSAPKSRTSAW